MCTKYFEEVLFEIDNFKIIDVISTSLFNGIENTIIGGESSIGGSSEITEEEQEDE